MSERAAPSAPGALREALFDLERANARERQSRLEAELLLDGLQVLSDHDRGDSLFERLLDVLRDGLGFADAFILSSSDAGPLTVIATTHARFTEIRWPRDRIIQRLRTGPPIAAYDVSGLAEWAVQPPHARAEVCSALHVLLRDGEAPAMLVCTHPTRGYFSAPHLHLAARLAPLAHSALRSFDTRRGLERLTRQLQVEMNERHRAELEAAMSRAQSEQASKLAALGEMAGGVAHEINNPLSIITALAGQLVELTSEPELDRAEVGEVASEIDLTARRIARIVAGLRTFSRDGSRDPFVRVKAQRLFDDALGLCAERFGLARVRIDHEPVDPELSVECRPTALLQVLVNLLNNAYDAVAGTASPWVRLSATARDGSAVIAVTDSGPGVPPEALSRIFQPFFTTKAVGKGTGLGLSISKGLVESHGGQLRYAPLGEHTRFVVEIPLRQGAPRP